MIIGSVHHQTNNRFGQMEAASSLLDAHISVLNGLLPSFPFFIFLFFDVILKCLTGLPVPSIPVSILIVSLVLNEAE